MSICHPLDIWFISVPGMRSWIRSRLHSLDIWFTSTRSWITSDSSHWTFDSISPRYEELDQIQTPPLGLLVQLHPGMKGWIRSGAFGSAREGYLQQFPGCSWEIAVVFQQVANSSCGIPTFSRALHLCIQTNEFSSFHPCQRFRCRNQQKMHSYFP